LGNFLHPSHILYSLSTLQKKNFHQNLKFSNFIKTFMKNIIFSFAALFFVACGTQAPCE